VCSSLETIIYSFQDFTNNLQISQWQCTLILVLKSCLLESHLKTSGHPVKYIASDFVADQVTLWNVMPEVRKELSTGNV